MEDKEKELKETKEAKKEKKHAHLEKIHELERQVKEFNDKYLRALADQENFKKRIQNERQIEKKYAASHFANELLVPYEQFVKVVEFPTDNELLKNFLIGFKMIKDQFQQILENEGVKEIKALNEKFDPSIHHAIEKDHDNTKESGIITEVLQKGYYFKDRVLRPAMVKVNERSEEQNG